jgi:hypothetical protein
MLLYVFNTGVSRAVGTALTAIVHVGGDLVAYFEPSLVRWGLIYNCNFLWHFDYEISLRFSYCFMMICLCLLFFSGVTFLRHADFKCSIGDEIE